MGRKHRTERKTKQVWFGQHEELDPPMFSVQQNSTKCGVCVEMLLSRQHDLIVCANWSPRNTRSARCLLPEIRCHCCCHRERRILELQNFATASRQFISAINKLVET